MVDYRLHFLMIFLKMIKIIYYEYVLLSSGRITCHDLVVESATSALLFYAFSILARVPFATYFVYFMLDSLVVMLSIVAYDTWYVRERNARAEKEAFQTNQTAEKEGERMQIDVKPVIPAITYQNLNHIRALGVVPYYLLFVEI